MDIRVLGNVEVHGDAGVVRLARAGERCVLAALAFSPRRPVSVASLADNIWPSARQSDKAIETVADYVRKVRAAIKKAGGRPDWVRTDRGTRSYVLDVDADRIDYGRFGRLLGAEHDAANIEALRQALGQWRGRALGDVTGLWAEGRRYAVEVERLNAYEIVLAHRLEIGHCAEVVSTVTELLDEVVPTDRLLVLGARAMVGAGQAAAVRGWLDHVTNRLRETVGTEPSPWLLAQVQRLTAGAAPALSPRSAAAPAMHGLRRDLAGFTGRQEESRSLLAEVRATVAGSAAAVFAVDGMAGIGKTTFCVHIGHQLAGDFPDGRLFVELHGHSPGQRPVPVAEALESLLLATGLASAALPRRLDDRARLWRHRIAGKRLLLILDDVADHDQIRLLLPGTPGCLVLITSRHRLAGLDDVVPLTLDVLPTDQATTMLARLARLDPEREDDAAAQEIVRRCGHLPLAVALVAGGLRSHPSWTLRYLADELARSHDGLEHLAAGDRSVAAAFATSFHNLTADQQLLFRLLGVHPGPEVDASAVAALLECSPAQAGRALASLYAEHLLREVVPGRYQLHDLLRAYANSRAEDLPAEDRERALDRLLNYYGHTAATACALLPSSTSDSPKPPAPGHRPDLPDADAAEKWLERELSVLATCVRSVGLGVRPQPAIALSLTLQPFLHGYGHWEQAVVLHQAALAGAVRSGDRAAEADLYLVLASMQRLRCDFPNALANATSALERYTDLGHRRGQADALQEIGVLRQTTGDYRSADEILTEAHQRRRDLGDERGQADTLERIGIGQYQLGSHDEATRTLTEAHQLYLQLGNRMGQAHAFRHLGIVARTRGHFREAAELFTAAQQLYADVGNRLGQANALKNLGTVRYQQGDHDAAISTLNSALRLYVAGEHRLDRANTVHELGVAHLLKGDVDSATRALTAAYQAYVEVDARLGQATSIKNLGVALRLAGKFPESADKLTTAYDRLSALGVRDDEIDALNDLGDLALDYPPAGDPGDYFGRALELAREHRLQLHEARALAGQACGLIATDPAAAAPILREAHAIYARYESPQAHALAALLATLDLTPAP